MPAAAKILIVEDEEAYRTNAKSSLTLTGHSIVAEVSTYDEFTNLHTQLKELEPSVAIVDANLTPGQHRGDEGRLIANWLRGNIPDIKIVAWSSGPTNYGDVAVIKGLQDADLTELRNAVAVL